MTAKKEMEHQFEERIGEMSRSIEMKQREMDSLAQKM